MKNHFWFVRFVSKLFLASGFLLSLYGAPRSDPFMVMTSLGLLAVGIVGMAASLYLSIKLQKAHRKSSDRNI